MLDINLAKLVGGSNLVNGFANPLASLPRIKLAIQQQQGELANGRAEDTGISADSLSRGSLIPGYGLGALDANTYQLGVLSPAVRATPQCFESVGRPGRSGWKLPNPASAELQHRGGQPASVAPCNPTPLPQ